jgi:hypothetical protein
MVYMTYITYSYQQNCKITFDKDVTQENANFMSCSSLCCCVFERQWHLWQCYMIQRGRETKHVPWHGLVLSLEEYTWLSSVVTTHSCWQRRRRRKIYYSKRNRVGEWTITKYDAQVAVQKKCSSARSMQPAAFVNTFSRILSHYLVTT